MFKQPDKGVSYTKPKTIAPSFPPLDAGRPMSPKKPAVVAPKPAEKASPSMLAGFAAQPLTKPNIAPFFSTPAKNVMYPQMSPGQIAANTLVSNFSKQLNYQPNDFQKFSNFTGITPEMLDRNNMSFIRTMFDPNKFPDVQPWGNRQTTIAGTPFRTKGVLGGGLPRKGTNAEITQDIMNLLLQIKGPLIGAGFLTTDRLGQNRDGQNSRFGPKNIYADGVTASKVIPYGAQMYKDVRSGNLIGAGQNFVNILESLTQTPTVDYLKNQTGIDYRGLLAWMSKLRRAGQGQ